MRGIHTSGSLYEVNRKLYLLWNKILRYLIDDVARKSVTYYGIQGSAVYYCSV